MSRALFIQLERLGDLIQTTPLLREYHAAHPDTEIHLLQLAENRQVLAGFAAVDRFHLIPQKQVSELNSQIDKHRDQSPDDAKAILDLLELPHFDSLINLTHGALGCWLANRIPANKKEGGLITNAGDWLWQGAWHAYLLAMLDFRDHNQFNLVDLYRAAGPGGSVSANARPFVAKAQRLPFSLPEGRLIALNPGASRANRRWPEASYAELALELKQQGFVPVLVGARGDAAVCEAVCSHLPYPIDSFWGQTSVAEMAFLLERCELLISNDTGAVHIASAVGTRCIGIYGASAWFRETAPWGSGHLVVQAKLDAALGTISVGDVINVVTASINGSAIKTPMSSDVTVWETALDSEDSLGGLSYHAVCGERDSSERFAKHFRTAFSMILMSGSVAKAANAESHEEADMLAASSALRKMADMAEESLEWLDTKHTPSWDALKTASQGIDKGIRELVATASRLPHIAPPVYWLYWVLRTAPVSDARDALALRVKECTRAAEILCTAHALYQDECHSAASVH